jgi:hypothetical protein
MKARVFAEIVIFAAGFALIFLWVQRLLQPKYMMASEYSSPETEIWSDFYAADKESIDVLYVGSSHVYNAVNTEVVEALTGYSGEVLAGSAQDIGTSYYYICEALRSQSPKYIFLDSYGFSWESFWVYDSFKRQLDDIRWSPVKLEAVRAWQETYPEDSLTARIFTVIDYHTRWESLNIFDFKYRSMISTVNGYAPTYEAEEVSHAPADETAGIDITEQNEEYFSKIAALCRENGIELIFMTTPSCDWTDAQSDVMQELADKYEIPYWDFNRDGVYDTIGLDGSTDYRDRNHLNAYGAEKFSTVLGEYCSEFM